MTIERHGSGSPFEARVGYCRVVRAGDMLHVAGCTSTGPDGVVLYPGDAYEQSRQALTNVGTALSLAGATFADVVRSRIYVTDISRWEDVGRAHAEVFGAAPPAATMVQVGALIDPRMLVEFEVDAYVPTAA
jgi:enamine deaminase RidA (YjgF/YER057c/UK114 family)